MLDQSSSSVDEERRRIRILRTRQQPDPPRRRELVARALERMVTERLARAEIAAGNAGDAIRLAEDTILDIEMQGRLREQAEQLDQSLAQIGRLFDALARVRRELGEDSGTGSSSGGFQGIRRRLEDFVARSNGRSGAEGAANDERSPQSPQSPPTAGSQQSDSSNLM